MTVNCFIILATANEVSLQAATRIIDNVTKIDPAYREVLLEPGRLAVLVQSDKTAHAIWVAIHVGTVSLRSVKVFSLGRDFSVGHDDLDLVSWIEERRIF